MNRANQHLLKLAVLEVIKSKKNILFASFQNSAVTKSEKEAAWREVLAKAQSVGIAQDKHDWVYARDKLFGLWKSRTLAKRDNARKTGKRGGNAVKLDVLDKMILDIVDVNSPRLSGLTLPEINGNTEFAEQAEYVRPTTSLPKDSNECSKKRKLPPNVSDNESEMNRLKKELLRVEIYKNKLKILKLETDLGLQPSEYTECIVNEKSTTITIKTEQ